eukprot:11205036-Lingulodinium_polyedra.AAC.1
MGRTPSGRSAGPGRRGARACLDFFPGPGAKTARESWAGSTDPALPLAFTPALGTPAFRRGQLVARRAPPR